MIQLQYMAPWIPAFSAAVEAELATKDYSPPFTLFTLATVDKEGYPHNRTMIYRGFLFDNKCYNVLTFCTDRRMAKYSELMHNDKFEAVFYFEKIKKQFRFRGHARLIDADHHPVLDLSTIQPEHLIETSMRSMDNSSDEDSDEELELAVKPKDNAITKHSAENSAQNGDMGAQNIPLEYPVVSPTVLGKILGESSVASLSYLNLAELSKLEISPPSKEEWDGEVDRVWSSLSKGLKRSFRRPAPLLPMDDANQNLVDKISRGVDGKKEESGLANFAVVAMFIDHVDYYEMEKDRRYLYSKETTFMWSEREVCP